MVLVVAVLATGTIVERLHPEVHIYTAWWFVALMAIVAVASVTAIVKERLWRRPAALLVHAAVPVILLGGALTTWVGRQGEMTLHPHQPTNTVNGEAVWELPFSIVLDSFEVVPYPGTRTPMDFTSHVSIDGEDYLISMNNILRHGGYRFYQADYGDDGSSVLSVSHDPWGIGVTYCGYGLLLIGLLWMLVAPDERFRRLLRSAAMMALVALPLTASARTPQTPPTLPRTTADSMGHLMVLYKGRVCPLQTFAKDFTTKLTGQATYRGLTAEQVLSGYMFYYDSWANEPAVKVKGGNWQTAYGLDGKRLSMRQMLALDTVRTTPASDKKLRAACEKYNLVRGLVGGKTLKLFPLPVDSTAEAAIGWYGQNDVLPMSVADDEYLFIRRWQSYCQEQVVHADMAELEHVFAKTRLYQIKRLGDAMPGAGRIRAERLYNTLTTGRWLALLSITLGLVVFAYALVADGRRRKMSPWVTTACGVWVTALTAFLALIFVLRWVVGGHAPMAGGFDSMNLMSIIIGITGLCLMRRHGIALPAAMLTMGFCQLVAMMSGSNPTVTNLMPVLNSPLLTMHVAVIMCSYALLFFVMIGGIAGLITGDERHRRLNLLLLYPAVTLLATGIIIGAVWANISWGNYWSWDPKEVWALITLIVYALPLQEGVLRRPRAFHLYCVLAFLSVVITYFGVNLLLGGMHAYN